MDIDAEKLVFLIENHPIIYNHKLKDHYNKIEVDRVWEEIANEMKCTAAECKIKWANLRNSYARILREKKMTIGTSYRRSKTWYLESPMSFMKDFMQQRSLKTNFFPRQSNQISSENLTEESKELLKNLSSSTHPDQTVKSTKLTSPPDSLEIPTFDFIRTQIQKIEKEEDPNFLFFRSLLPDLNKLSEKGQRMFKQNTIVYLNELLENESNSTTALICVKGSPASPNIDSWNN